jgi:hypothetical protein
VLNFVKDKVFKTDPMPISRVKELLSRKRPQQRSGLTGEDFDRLGDATDIEVVATTAMAASCMQPFGGSLASAGRFTCPCLPNLWARYLP